MNTDKYHLNIAYLGSVTGLMLIFVLQWMKEHNVATFGIIMIWSLIGCSLAVVLSSLIFHIQRRKEEHDAQR